MSGRKKGSDLVRGREEEARRNQYFRGIQLCSLPPPAGGCAELVAMRKIAPPRIKYHWNTAQQGVNTQRTAAQQGVNT